MNIADHVAGLTMPREMQEPVAAMSFVGMDEKRRVEFSTGFALQVLVQRVLDQRSPSRPLPSVCGQFFYDLCK